MSEKKAMPTGLCWCGCGKEVRPGKFFYHSKEESGHDSRAATYLKELGYERERIADFILRSGFDPSTNRLKPAWERRVRRLNARGRS